MSGGLVPAWVAWALGSAGFAALTAILAKLGVDGVASDVATLIRTLVVVLMLAAIVVATGQSLAPSAVPARSWLFLLLSGLATGTSWLCYFRALKLGPASRVAPVDKLSVVLVALFGVLFLGERLSGINWVGVALIAGGVILLAIR
ncbi:EamA family transporter [Azospirillum picis]|uniref:Transporter family protein n=1 Tax=Azospirillum picis TaxID=488438 RepID=A0ABU0MM95_9PROT|nr:EamA family transporter [Azospirillum picis]MBP2301047.1 transporter family protein [Azospirillum picis]MDQ0534333.1 transporter family protein [Azospirillum picis]